jgi:hypothetical protein
MFEPNKLESVIEDVVSGSGMLFKFSISFSNQVKFTLMNKSRNVVLCNEVLIGGLQIELQNLTDQI